MEHRFYEGTGSTTAWLRGRVWSPEWFLRYDAPLYHLVEPDGYGGFAVVCLCGPACAAAHGSVPPRADWKKVVAKS